MDTGQVAGFFSTEIKLTHTTGCPNAMHDQLIRWSGEDFGTPWVLHSTQSCACLFNQPDIVVSIPSNLVLPESCSLLLQFDHDIVTDRLFYCLTAALLSTKFATDLFHLLQIKLCLCSCKIGYKTSWKPCKKTYDYE